MAGGTNPGATRSLPGHPELHFRELHAAEVPQAVALEINSYPADEAATPEKLEYRQRVAPELFYGVYSGNTLVGFIVSTAAHSETLEEESMSKHEPGGQSVCIHSVVVDAAWRRRGLARSMVQAYVEAVATDMKRCGSVRRMLLLSHAPLLGLYKQCGFEFLGPSAVVHGADQWFDMELDILAKRQVEFVQVDAFTPVALAGNPAAVLFTHRGGNEEWMQAVAVENNLSETAFLERRAAAVEEGEAWDIRWFTPGAEVALCGHATLASAHALWDTNRVTRDTPISFHTRKAGVLNCVSHGKAADSWIRMDFPAQPPMPAGADAPRDLLVAAFGLREADVLYLGLGPPTTPDWLLEVTPVAFAGLMPDMGAIASIRPMERGVIVTCVGRASSGCTSGEAGIVAGPCVVNQVPRVLRGAAVIDAAFDFTSRFFGPNLGINEDPVTGSAHCILAPYWAQKLGRPPGTDMMALQASARGGVLRVSLRTDTAGGTGLRVDIGGQAATVIRGRMAV